MNVGEVIWEDGICDIKFERELPAPAYIVVNGEKYAVGNKGFQFCLYKGDKSFKYFSTVSKYPYDYEKMKSEVITAFKKYI